MPLRNEQRRDTEGDGPENGEVGGVQGKREWPALSETQSGEPLWGDGHKGRKYFAKLLLSASNSSSVKGGYTPFCLTGWL